MDDRVLFKKIVKSQNASPADITDVLIYAMQGRIIRRNPVGKRRMWIEKRSNTEFYHLQQLQASKIIFDKLIPIYSKTAKFLFESAFCDETDTVLKPHYITIANKLLKVVDKLKTRSFNQAVMINFAYEVGSYA